MVWKYPLHKAISVLIEVINVEVPQWLVFCTCSVHVGLFPFHGVVITGPELKKFPITSWSLGTWVLEDVLKHCYFNEIQLEPIKYLICSNPDNLHLESPKEKFIFSHLLPSCHICVFSLFFWLITIISYYLSHISLNKKIFYLKYLLEDFTFIFVVK